MPRPRRITQLPPSFSTVAIVLTSPSRSPESIQGRITDSGAVDNLRIHLGALAVVSTVSHDDGGWLRQLADKMSEIGLHRFFQWPRTSVESGGLIKNTASDILS